MQQDAGHAPSSNASSRKLSWRGIIDERHRSDNPPKLRGHPRPAGLVGDSGRHFALSTSARVQQSSRWKEKKKRKQDGRLHPHFPSTSFADISRIASARSFWMREDLLDIESKARAFIECANRGRDLPHCQCSPLGMTAPPTSRRTALTSDSNSLFSESDRPAPTVRRDSFSRLFNSASRFFAKKPRRVISALGRAARPTCFSKSPLTNSRSEWFDKSSNAN